MNSLFSNDTPEAEPKVLADFVRAKDLRGAAIHLESLPILVAQEQALRAGFSSIGTRAKVDFYKWIGRQLAEACNEAFNYDKFLKERSVWN